MRDAPGTSGGDCAPPATEGGTLTRTAGSPWAAPLPLLFAVAAHAALIALTNVSAEYLPGARVPVVWMANGLQLGLLLVVPAGLRLRYGVGFLLGGMLVGALSGTSLLLGVGSPLVNAAEVALAVWLLGARRAWIDGHSEHPRDWLRFVAVVVAAPALGAMLGAPLVQASFAGTIAPDLLLDTARIWYVNDAVALWLVTPAVLRLRPGLRCGAQGHPVRPATMLPALALGTAVSTVVLVQPDPLLLGLLPAVLLILLIRHGVSGTVAGVTVVTLLALTLTRLGVGPFLATARDEPPAGGDLAAAQLSAQLFLTIAMLTVLLVAALQSDRTRLGGQRAAWEGVYRMMADDSPELIVVTGPAGEIVYVSPAARTGSAHGGPRGYWGTEEVHPDDRPAISEALAALRSGTGEARCTWRARTDDGGGVRWFETRVRSTSAVADPRDGLTVLVSRDVTAFMRRQEALEQSNATLLGQATTDPLTGLANRRRLEHETRAAWARSAREGLLAVLMIDVDHFKAYNDTLGHQAGDECLVRVAGLIAGVARGHGGMVARFGGEEFVVLLGSSNGTVARAVGDTIRTEVCSATLPHPGSPLGTVTVSVGVAVGRPPDVATTQTLFAEADAALYRAKQRGRDRVEGPEPRRTRP